MKPKLVYTLRPTGSFPVLNLSNLCSTSGTYDSHDGDNGSDWVYCRLSAPVYWKRKSEGGNRLDFAPINGTGSAPPANNSANFGAVTYREEDAGAVENSASATNSSGGGWVAETNTTTGWGLEWPAIPCGQADRTINWNLMLYGGKFRIDAAVSDGSSPPIVQEFNCAAFYTNYFRPFSLNVVTRDPDATLNVKITEIAGATVVDRGIMYVQTVWMPPPIKAVQPANFNRALLLRRGIR